MLWLRNKGFQTLQYLVIVALISILPEKASALVYHISGEVLDSITHEPVPGATLRISGTRSGGHTNAAGRFEIESPIPVHTVKVSSMGYETRILPVAGQDLNHLTFLLPEKSRQLAEVTVTPKKEKYTKKDNPAVRFAKMIDKMGERTDPRRNPYYSFDRYERITLALNNVDSTKSLLRGLPELINYIDTSEVSGKPILNISVKEKASDVHYRRDPKTEKTFVTGIRQRGIDEAFDQQSIQVLLEDIFREVDVYDNDINILQNRFVSPLSPIAPDFYKFYLNDTVTIDSGERCTVLTFVPRSPESFGFTGKFYVLTGDTTMFIKKIEMGVPSDINLNFIDKLYINQEYDKAPDGSRLKKRDDMTMEISILGQGFYARRNTAYSNHSFEAPTTERIFDARATVTEMPGATAQTDYFWDTHRLIPISRQEAMMGQMVTEMRRNKVYYWTEKAIAILGKGYIMTGNPSKFDIGPVNTTISGNSLEGVRLRFGGMTTAALSNRLFFRGYGAYGLHDHRWKYLAEAEYSFHDKKIHQREFPVHSIAITSLYDVDMLGQHYLFTNPDNFVLSLKRTKDRQMTYHHVNKLTYTLELENNFSVKAIVGHERQCESPFMSFINGYGDVSSHYDETSLTVELRYAPGEKFFQTRTHRLPVNLDAPVIVLSHTIAPKGFPGNKFCINKTELSFQKRWWFSAFGFTDMILRCGHVWSQSPYPNLLIPNANLSYTIQPESFALMNAMEFINDSYASWDLTYWANGLIFNRIPLFKKLKLREAIGFRGIWGHLSDKNNPQYNNELYRFPVDAHTRLMTSTPYMELSVGVDNLFKILRLDYVWRLSYRNTPDAPNGGLRVALHFTF